MNKEEIEELKNFTIDLTDIDELALLESMFELSELEELKHKHYLIQGGRGNGKTYLLHLQQENKELKDNWNKIKQIIENERMSHWAPSPLFLTELLSKMQELEKSDSNEQGRI